MPLSHGKSRKAFSHNVEVEMEAGKPQKQAVAIAYSEKRAAERKHKAAGGCIGEGCSHPSHYDEGGEVSTGTTSPAPHDTPPAVNAPSSLGDAWKRVKAGIMSTDSPMVQRSQTGGYADGGEVEEEHEMPLDHEMPEIDNELMEACAEECMHCLETKDKKGFIEAIKALVMSCME